MKQRMMGQNVLGHSPNNDKRNGRQLCGFCLLLAVIKKAKCANRPAGGELFVAYLPAKFTGGLGRR